MGSVEVCEGTGSSPGQLQGPVVGAGGGEGGGRGPTLQFCPFLWLLGRKPATSFSHTAGPYLLHSLAKPGLRLGKRELGRQSWRRGRAGARGVCRLCLAAS